MGLLELVKSYRNRSEEIEDEHLYDINIDDSDIQSSYIIQKRYK
ncbi:MAG: hypothetical protein ACTSX0_02670 [Promethearchaeota archaeon]